MMDGEKKDEDFAYLGERGRGGMVKMGV